MIDPVSLIVRNEYGITVAETEECRDLSLIRFSDHRCAVFCYNGLMPIVPWDIWWLEGAEIRKAQ